jgi:hypothetical protein
MSKIKDTTRVPRCVHAVLNKTESHSLVKTGKERGNNRGYPSPAPEATLVTPGTFSWRGRVLSNTLRRIARACSPMATAPSMFVKWTPIPGAIPQSRRPKGKNFRRPTPPAGTHGCPKWAPGRSQEETGSPRERGGTCPRRSRPARPGSRSNTHPRRGWRRSPDTGSHLRRTAPDPSQMRRRRPQRLEPAQRITSRPWTLPTLDPRWLGPMDPDSEAIIRTIS